MSVLIKGIGMPETCDDCQFHRYHSRGEYVCVATPMFYPMNLANSKGIRKDWCPLVELPEKHGKLIDGIELIDYCKDMIRLSRENDEDMRYIIISEICYKNVISKIINMPTLLEAEGEE